MINKTEIRERFIIVLFIAIAMMGMVFVGAADEDYEDVEIVEYDTDNETHEEVPFNYNLEVTGEGIEDDEEYVLESIDENTVIKTDEAEDGTITLDPEDITDEVDDVRGDYQYADPIHAEITADDQDTDGESVEVESADANVDYRVAVVNESEDEIIGMSGEFEKDYSVKDLHIDLVETVEEDDNLRVYVVDGETELPIESQNDDEIIYEEIEVTGTDEEMEDETDVEESELVRFTAPFEIVDSEFETDQRIIPDAEGEEITDVYVGQELVFADEEFDTDDSVHVEYIAEEDETETITELPIEESETVHDGEVIVDTSYEDHNFDELVGDFKMTHDGETLVEWTTTEHEITTEQDTEFINLNHPDTAAEVDVTSDRLGFDLEIHDEDKEPEEILAILEQDEFDEDRISVRDDHVRISDFTAESNEETVPFEFEDTESHDYELEFNAADSEATSTAEIDVEFSAQGDATLDRSIYTQNNGDLVEFDLELTATDETTFKFNDDGFDVEFTVVDEENDGSVTVIFDSYEVKDADVIGDVFETDSDSTEIAESDEELPETSGNLEEDAYTIEIFTDDDITDMSTLNIVERSSDEIRTNVLPKETNVEDAEDIDDAGTETDKVAEEDMLALEFEASGLDSILEDEPHPASFIDFSERDYDSIEEIDENNPELDLSDVEEIDELNIEVIDEEPGRNVPNKSLPLEHAEDEIILDEEQDRFFIVINTDTAPIDDTLGKHSVTMDLTEDFNLNEADEDDNEIDLETEFEIVERTVYPQLDTTTVDEPTRDTRFEIPAEDEFELESETEIAPGTELSVRLLSEGEVPVFMKEDLEVDEDGIISDEYDFSELETDRDVDIEYYPVDDADPAVITEPVEPPEITSLDASTTSPSTGESISFESTVENAEDVEYDWDFGDDESSSQEEPSHEYEDEGTYTAELTVTNEDGESDTAEVEIQATEETEEPEIVDTIAPSEVYVDEEVNMGIFATDPSGDNSEISYEWDLGDDTTEQGTSVTHTYTETGTYTVGVTVTDEDGETAEEVISIDVVGDEDEDENDDEKHELTVEALDSEDEEAVENADVTIVYEDETVDEIETDENGQATIELEDGEYEIAIEGEEYEPATGTIEIDGEDDTVEMNLVEEEDDDGDDEDDDPDQPGFGLLIAAGAVLAIGSIFYYRREN